MMSKKRNSYTANFRLLVIAFSESSNNSMAARHFSVNEKQVREWRKRQGEIAEMPKSVNLSSRDIKDKEGLFQLKLSF